MLIPERLLLHRSDPEWRKLLEANFPGSCRWARRLCYNNRYHYYTNDSYDNNNKTTTTKQPGVTTMQNLDPDVPLSGHITDHKVQLTCARCGRTSTHDRPRWFSATEMKRQREALKNGSAVIWVQNPETVPPPLELVDLGRCPCGERYVAVKDERGTVLLSAFPKKRAPLRHDETPEDLP